MATKPPKAEAPAPAPARSKTIDERNDELHEASMKHRARVQAEAKAERAKPAAPYHVGRAALDEAMRILGRPPFTNE